MNAKNRKSTQPMTKDGPILPKPPQRRAIFPCNQQGGSKAFQELPTCPRQLANLRTQRLHQIFLAMQLRDSSVLLEEFLKMVFSDENILDAYFFPKPIWDFMGADQPVGFPASGALPDWIPKDVASRSAAQAASMALIRPCERRVTQLATFLYPCGHFYYARNQALSGREGVILNLEQVGTMRSLLLARPLHHLYGPETWETGVRGHRKHLEVSGNSVQQVQIQPHKAVVTEKHIVMAIVLGVCPEGYRQLEQRA